MAGQPQENSWSQQGHGYSPGAPGYGPAYEQQEQGQWQGQPAPYQPPPQPYEQQQAYGEQPAAYDQRGQPAYTEQPTVYDQQPTAYDQGGQQAYAHQPPQAYPGQPQPGQPQAQSEQTQQVRAQDWERWQLSQQQARPPKQKQKKVPRPASGGSGFVGSLFDFSFSSFVTPKIIKALYALVAVWTILWAVILLFIGNHLGHMGGLLFVLIIVDPILILVSLGTLRVVLEFFMVTFRMQEDLKALRDQAGVTARGDSGGVTADTSGPDVG